jgi:acyl carrier protein
MVFNRVIEVVVDHLRLDNTVNITADTSLMKDLGADSLDAVEIIMDLEDEFSVTIPDEVSAKFTCIGDITSYIEANK